MEKFSGKLVMHDPFEIVVDRAYQRDQKASLVYAIANDFSWEAFGAPVCFERSNGMLYCADGQQRISAIGVMSEPPRSIPVVVFPMHAVKDEAAIFARINEYRTALRPHDKHKAKVVAEDPAALGVERAVEKAGFSLSTGGVGVTDIQAIGTINGIYNRLGEDGVAEVLFVIREAWPEDRNGTSASILKVVGTIIEEQGEKYDRRKLTDKLSGTLPSMIERKARELRLDLSGSLAKNMRRAVKVLVKV